MRLALLLAAAASLVVATPADAARTVDARGLVAVPFEVRNSGDAPIRCQAEIAHWFATDLAAIPPNRQARLDLRFHTASGTWAAMNAHGEALPVERAWCGIDGRTYESRWDLPLARAAPQPRAVECRAEGTGLTCR